MKPIDASIVYLSPDLLSTYNYTDYTYQSGYDSNGNFYNRAVPKNVVVPGYIPAWAIIGFAGSFGGLASLSVKSLPFAPDKWTSDDWNTLKSLSDGVVIVPLGTSFTLAGIALHQTKGMIPDQDERTRNKYVYSWRRVLKMGDPVGVLGLYVEGDEPRCEMVGPTPFSNWTWANTF